MWRARPTPVRPPGLAGAAVCLAIGCGGTSPPPPADAPTSAAAPASAPAASAARAPAEADALPTVKVTEVVGSAEGTAYMKVTAVFTNPSSQPCTIRRYTLVWSGGTKQIELEDFSIPAGSSRQRSVKVHPDDGDLKTLTMQSAHIDLPKCGRP